MDEEVGLPLFCGKRALDTLLCEAAAPRLLALLRVHVDSLRKLLRERVEEDRRAMAEVGVALERERERVG